MTIPASLETVGTPTGVAPGAMILIVDDNATNIGLLAKILARAGMTGVRSTTDPREAIDLYRRHSPDLVMIDLHMPQMDGLHLMDALAAMTADDDLVPIIVLTADGTSAARDRVLVLHARQLGIPSTDLGSERDVVFAELGVQRPGVEQVPRAQDHLGTVERLGQEVARAGFQHSITRGGRAVGGEDDDRHQVVFGRYLRERVHEMEPVHIRHVEIDHHEIR